MQRVVAVDKDGNIYSKEDEKIGHNELIYELFEEFLEPLQDEVLQGDAYIRIWPNAGIITKYLDMMLYLETFDDKASIDSTICIIPEEINDILLSYYENNYLNHDEPFLGLHYHNGVFNTLSEDRTKDFTAKEVHNFLNDMVKSKSK